MEAVMQNPSTYELSKEKQNELNELVREDLKSLEVDLLKQILLENGIEFDNQISDYQELKKNLKATADKDTIRKIEEQENQSRKELSEFIREIQVASPQTAKTIVSNFSERFAKPATKAIATLGISRLLFDAMLFLPCPLRTITGATTLIGTTLISKIAHAKQKREEQSKQYDSIIDELAKTRDKDGKVLEDHFFAEQVEVIEKFFAKNNKKIETIPYSNMMNEIYSLKNKDKLKLINELIASLNGKIDINKELAKDRRKKMLKSIVKGIESTVSTLGIGMLLSNLDKEIVDLVNIFLPEETRHSKYTSRVTNGTQPKGLFAGMGIMGIATLVTSGIKAFSEKHKVEQRAEENAEKEFSTNQKILFNIIRNRELYAHPERSEEILKISTLSELKQYTKTLPLEEQKAQMNLTEDLKSIVDKKSIKDTAKSLGKTLVDSAKLAGKSMLLYQVLLHLQFILSPKNLGSKSPKEEPQEETASERVKVKVTNDATAKNGVKSKVPPVFPPVPAPGANSKEQVPSAVPDPSYAQASSPVTPKVAPAQAVTPASTPAPSYAGIPTVEEVNAIAENATNAKAGMETGTSIPEPKPLMPPDNVEIVSESASGFDAGQIAKNVGKGILASGAGIGIFYAFKKALALAGAAAFPPLSSILIPFALT